MTNNWLTDLEEEVLTPNVALRLQYKLIKYIAEFLESQQDRYNLCFVNKAWTPAAINVLWSEPIFKTPDSIYYFLQEVLTPNVALRLQYKLIKYIAEFLESQQDRYNLCFVNKAWTPAAINVLWSEPIFKTPDSIYYFLRVVKQSKQRALRIRVLNLCAPEGNNVNSFAPVLCSDHIEHKIMSTYFISKPNLLTNLVRLCENLRKIKVYGWNLSDSHIQSLPQYCPELKEILVIGNNQLTHKAFHSLMSCISDLRVLDLDGVFKLSDNFAEALAIKCPSLCSLKLSTKEISEKGFDTLATKLTKLNNLILQNCL
ncbi:15357_t:CDS:2 [Entrophospora sp. SA101]|nr:15357_t:CDS:2 [Entrophospora sp. SA101]